MNLICIKSYISCLVEDLSFCALVSWFGQKNSFYFSAEDILKDVTLQQPVYTPPVLNDNDGADPQRKLKHQIVSDGYNKSITDENPILNTTTEHLLNTSSSAEKDFQTTISIGRGGTGDNMLQTDDTTTSSQSYMIHPSYNIIKAVIISNFVSQLY